MSTKLWDRIDKFYLIVIAVLLILGFLAFLSIRTVYKSMQALNNTSSEAVESIGIDESGLREATQYLNQNQTIPLDL